MTNSAANATLSAVLPSVALVGLLVLPPTGIVAHRLLLRLAPRQPKLSAVGAFAPHAATFAALVLAWTVLFVRAEAVIGGWLPVSLTGTVLALSTTPAGAGVIIALLSVQLDALLRNEGAARLALSRALQLPALALIAFGDNVITLLVGLGLSDLLHAQASLAVARSAARTQPVLRFALSLIALAVLLIGFAADYTANQTLTLSLVQLPSTLAALPALALGLRLGFVPLSRIALPQPSQGVPVDLLSTLVLQARLAEIGWSALPDWYYAWALVSVLQGLVLAVILPSERGAALSLAGAGFASTCGVFGNAPGVLGSPSPSGTLLIAAVAWVIGSHLLVHPLENAPAVVQQVQRLAGGLALLTLPPTVGFVARSGLIEHYRYTELGGALAGLTLLASLAFAGTAAWVLRTEIADAPASSAHSWRQLATEVGQSTLLGAPLVGFTFAAELFGVGNLAQVLSRTSFLGWAALVLTALACAGGWLVKGTGIEARVHALQAALACGAQGMQMLVLLVGAALQRLSAPFARAFELLESESALIWTVILVLLVLLIASGGQP
ncbi:MAG: hypothetical protein RMM31_02750 [Anaerolineae bacterium]|nr:hypothetical protein [Anaerolineae bacterium]